MGNIGDITPFDQLQKSVKPAASKAAFATKLKPKEFGLTQVGTTVSLVAKKADGTVVSIDLA